MADYVKPTFPNTQPNPAQAGHTTSGQVYPAQNPQPQPAPVQRPNPNPAVKPDPLRPARRDRTVARTSEDVAIIATHNTEDAGDTNKAALRAEARTAEAAALAKKRALEDAADEEQHQADIIAASKKHPRA